MMAPIALIENIYRTYGQYQYDNEAVSQLEHACQCAYLAEIAQQPPDLVVACFLHDLGHLLLNNPTAIAFRHEWSFPSPYAYAHEDLAALYLQPYFPKSIIEPIRLHVQAKRYLCVMSDRYWAKLSPASQASLLDQGGIFSEADAQAFIVQPYAAQAVALRIWDDRAKDPHCRTPNLNHYMKRLESQMLPRNIESNIDRLDSRTS